MSARVPFLATVRNRLQDLEDYREAERVRYQVQAEVQLLLKISRIRRVNAEFLRLKTPAKRLVYAIDHAYEAILLWSEEEEGTT